MLGKYLLGRSNLRKRLLLINENPFKIYSNTRHFSDIKCKLRRELSNPLIKYSCGTQARLLQTPTFSVFFQHRKWVSKGLIDDIFQEENVKEKAQMANLFGDLPSPLKLSQEDMNTTAGSIG